MRGVMQSRLNQVNGDCFQACLATIFEVPLSDLPEDHTDDMAETLALFNEWLAPRGLYMVDIVFHEDVVEDRGWPLGYTIGQIGGPGWEHVVVCYDGEVVWDPDPTSPPLGHPSRPEPDFHYIFIAKEPDLWRRP